MDMSVSSVPGVVLLVRDGDGGDDDGSGGGGGGGGGVLISMASGFTQRVSRVIRW